VEEGAEKARTEHGGFVQRDAQWRAEFERVFDGGEEFVPQLTCVIDCFCIPAIKQHQSRPKQACFASFWAMSGLSGRQAPPPDALTPGLATMIQLKFVREELLTY